MGRVLSQVEDQRPIYLYVVYTLGCVWHTNVARLPPRHARWQVFRTEVERRRHGVERLFPELVSDRVATPSTDVYLQNFAEFLGCQVSNPMACLASTA